MKISMEQTIRRAIILVPFFLLIGLQPASLGAQAAAQIDEQIVAWAVPPNDPELTEVKKTHFALFDTYFPINDLPEEFQPYAKEVRREMWSAFQRSDFMGLLKGFTDPQLLHPGVREYLVRHPNLAVQKFLRQGYAALTPVQRQDFFKVLLESPFNGVRRIAATMRQVYNSIIYGFPLGNLIAGIKEDETYVDEPTMKDRVEAYKAKLPPSQLTWDAETKTIVRKDGKEIDYLIVGSGPGGAVMAHELRSGQCGDPESEKKHPCTVVLVDRGPFVVPGTTNTWSRPELMYQGANLSTADGGIFIRAGKALGGGSTVNVDLAFSPLEATAQARIRSWSQKFLVDPNYYTIANLSDTYRWVTKTIETREVHQGEINKNNQKLWDGAREFGVDPSLYNLNRFEKDSKEESLISKRSAVRMLLTNALRAVENPLSVIPDAKVTKLLFEQLGEGDVRVHGVKLTMGEPWNDHSNTVVDPSTLGIAPKTKGVVIKARNVILAAGSIGTTELLLRSQKSEPALNNPLIGQGMVLHPAMPIIGVFCDPEKETCEEQDRVNLLDGLRESVHVDAFGIEPGFILECMSALPSYGAVMVPGQAKSVFQFSKKFNWMAGFGVLLIDTPSEHNQIVLKPDNEEGAALVEYSLSESDMMRLRKGVGIAIRMMFLAGAKQVVIPSNENFLGEPNFDPTVGTYLTDIEQVRKLERTLEFTPNRTILTSAHMQSSNKMGPTPEVSVVSWKHRVWNDNNDREISNLYIMDSSIFPTSVGANPMQTIYTFAKILADRLNAGID